MMNEVKKAKRALIKELVALVKPKLHKSGYPDVMLACFKDKSGYRSYKIKGYTLEAVGGVTEDGLITDAWGGGLVTTRFQDLPVEDLVKAKELLTKRYHQLL